MKPTETEKIFIGVIRQHEKVIYKVCSFYVSEEHPLPDLYQEVVYNLWKSFTRFRNESSISTWIYRIALNTCISSLRKKKIHFQTEIPVTYTEENSGETEDKETEEKIKEMYRLINHLSVLEKAIIFLYLEEKSYQEIADITGLTLSNVATKIKRCKEKLKEMSNN